MASVVDGRRSVASELKYTGQRLLTTSAYACAYADTSVLCRYTHTCTHRCVDTSWALGQLKASACGGWEIGHPQQPTITTSEALNASLFLWLSVAEWNLVPRLSVNITKQWHFFSCCFEGRPHTAQMQYWNRLFQSVNYGGSVLTFRPRISKNRDFVNQLCWQIYLNFGLGACDCNCLVVHCDQIDRKLILNNGYHSQDGGIRRLPDLTANFCLVSA